MMVHFKPPLARLRMLVLLATGIDGSACKPPRRLVATFLRLASIWLLMGAAICPAAETTESLRLTLPPAVYAVVGGETNIYFDNIVLTETPAAYRFEVECDLGRSEERRWTMAPVTGDQGAHRLRVTVFDAGQQPLGTAETMVHVVPADAGAGRAIRLLLVGDSLTHATLYPNELARCLSAAGNPTWNMLGTHRPSQAAEGVRHEGYGGWTWQRFVSHYEPVPDGTYRKRSSPFVFQTATGQPKLDVARYLVESCDNQPPDFVIFLLGINDCFSANPSDPAALDARIDAVFAQADTLLAAFRQAAPKARLGLCLTTPPNSRQAAFQANYGDRYSRWNWKRIQHRLVERQIERYGKREAERLYLVPTELNLDPSGGYPENNGVHPNAAGYGQIAASMYAWLKYRLDADHRED